MSRVTLCALLLLAMSNASSASGLGLRLEGATVWPYEAPAELGNGMGLHLTYDLDTFQISLGGGYAFPGSRVEGPLIIGQLMTQWHPVRQAPWAQELTLSPYVSLGLGIVNFADEEEARLTFEAEDSVRWIHHSEQLMGHLGLGLTYGSPEHLYLCVEARAANHTHMAFVLGAGVRF